MDLRAQLLVEHSKQNCRLITDYIAGRPDRFDELMELYFSNEYRITQRAAQVVSNSVERWPALIRPHLSALIHNLENPGLHIAVKRNSVRLLQFDFIPLPEPLWGLLAELVFTFLNNPKETIAVRVFSMSVAYRLCEHIPELKAELRMILEDQVPYGSAGFKSRGRKILKLLE